MHIIIAGATGQIGSEVLHESLRHPLVTKVTLLQRRPLPNFPEDATSATLASLSNLNKLTTIIHTDFLSYPPKLLAQLEGADGIVWCLGISGPFPQVDRKLYEVVVKDYPLAAAKALSGLKKAGEKKFVFAYCSAIAASQEGKSPFWVANAKGDAEASLAALRSTHPIATYFFRPAQVWDTIPPSASFFESVLKRKLLWTLASTVLIMGNEIGQAMIESVLKGGSGEMEGWPNKGLPGDENTFGIGEMKSMAAGSELGGGNVKL